MPDSIVERPASEIGAALRARRSAILERWRAQTRLESKAHDSLAIDEFRDDVDRVLELMARAMESDTREAWVALAEAAPAHGYERFEQHFTLAELLHEGRTLRRVTVNQVEDAIGRQMSSDESASLHLAIDYLVQQGVLALSDLKQQELKAASESRLQHLSFISHDLGNNLMILRFRMESMKRDLAGSPAFETVDETIDAALMTIDSTMQGMRQLVAYQGLRKGRVAYEPSKVHLREQVLRYIRLIGDFASLHSVRFDVRIGDGVVVHTDENLLSLILQNLLSNAVRHANANGGVVTIEASRRDGAAVWTIEVGDEGPGIPEQTQRAIAEICDCDEAEAMDVPGVGLGLVIASRAAKILGTRLEVGNRPAGGAAVRFTLPAWSEA